MKVIGVAIILAPVAVFVTILILPLWSWIEATFGIESIGHSGPAEWCYLATYLVCVSIVMMLRFSGPFRRNSRKGSTEDEGLS